MSKWIVLGFFIVLGFRVYLYSLQNKYERLPRDYVDMANYVDVDTLPIYEEIERTSVDFRSLYPTSERIVPMFFNERYWVIVSGVYSFDSGLKYFYTPDFSRVIVISRPHGNVVFNGRVNSQVTNAAIVDGKLYFVYASWFKYRLGRFGIEF